MFDQVFGLLLDSEAKSWRFSEQVSEKFQGYTSLLTCVSHHVSVNMHPSKGINVSLFIVHTESSVNCLHYEDQLIDCVHLMHAGSSYADKIVLAVSLLV